MRLEQSYFLLVNLRTTGKAVLAFQKSAEISRKPSTEKKIKKYLSMIDFAHPQVMVVIMSDESAGRSTEQRERAGRPWSEVNESVSGRTRPATTNLGSPELDLYPNWLLQERY